MNCETITVHKALCELKTLNKRCSKAIESIIPVSVKEESAKKVNGQDLKDFSDQANTGLQQATDLIARYCAIKAAVNHYNATTMITINNAEYSIAQAIWMMQHGMDEKKQLLRQLTIALNGANRTMERTNGEELNRKAEAAAAIAIGAKEKSDPQAYLDFLADYKARHTMVLVDPLDIRSKIKNLETEISEFEANVDAAIQVANATHTIDIKY